MSEDQGRRSMLPLSGERQAARTTIVGGQPPGNTRPQQVIPTGIEELLAMAAVDASFAAALERDRAMALEASGVELTATERAIFDAIDASALRRMTGSVGHSLPEQDRRTFLGRSAAALVALVGGASVTSGCDRGLQSVPAGVRPDRPASQPVTPSPPVSAPAPKPTAAPAPTEPTPASAPAPLTRPIGGLVARPDAGRIAPRRGIRPDRPTKGHRPDRP